MSGVGRGARLFPSVVEAIGDTPLVELSRMTAGLDGRILAKLDYLNPGASKKDRIARQILDDAAASGALRPGQPVVELTSGNAGTGAAIVCAVRGHPFTAVMSAGNSPERARMMRALGAEVIIVPQTAGGRPGQVSGEDLAIAEARTSELVAQRNAFRIDQFERASNALAHELHTAREIWEASDGQVTAFCDFAGSGGTFAGLWRGLKARNPGVRGYIVEPAGAAVLRGGGEAERPEHVIQGGGYSMPRLAQLDGIEPDGFLTVSNEEAVAGARQLARREGIFAGFSSGANLSSAVQLLEGPERGGVVAIVMCDSGMKYLSTDLWP